MFPFMNILNCLPPLLALCSYQFHPKPSPRDKPLGHDSKGAKTLPRDNHCVQKSSPGQNKEFKGPTPGDIKIENSDTI